MIPPCMSYTVYYIIAITTQHDCGSLKKKEFIWAHGSRGSKSFMSGGYCSRQAQGWSSKLRAHILNCNMKQIKQARSRRGCLLSVLAPGMYLWQGCTSKPPHLSPSVQTSEPIGHSHTQNTVLSQAAQRQECDSGDPRFGSQFWQSLNVWLYTMFFSVSQFLQSQHCLKGQKWE